MVVALVLIVALPGLHEGFSVIPPYNWIAWGACGYTGRVCSCSP